MTPPTEATLGMGGEQASKARAGMVPRRGPVIGQPSLRHRAWEEGVFTISCYSSIRNQCIVDFMRRLVRLSCFHSTAQRVSSGALLASTGLPPDATPAGRARAAAERVDLAGVGERPANHPTEGGPEAFGYMNER